MIEPNIAHDESERKLTGWPAYLRRLRRAASWLHYTRHRTRRVADTPQGRNTLTALLLAEESRDSIMNRAPWLTDTKYDALAACAQRVRDEASWPRPIGVTIGRFLRLTDDERTRWKLWHMWPIDKTRTEIRARQAAAKIVKRRGERWKLREKIMREGPTGTNDREQLLLSIIATPRASWKPYGERWPGAEIVKAVTSTRPRQLLPGVTVIPRDTFAQGQRLTQASIGRIVRRVLDRLEDRGLIESRYHIERGLRVRTVQIKLPAGQADCVPIDRNIEHVASAFCPRPTRTAVPVRVANDEKRAKASMRQDIRPQCGAVDEMVRITTRARQLDRNGAAPAHTANASTKTLRPFGLPIDGILLTAEAHCSSGGAATDETMTIDQGSISRETPRSSTAWKCLPQCDLCDPSPITMQLLRITLGIVYKNSDELHQRAVFRCAKPDQRPERVISNTSDILHGSHINPTVPAALRDEYLAAADVLPVPQQHFTSS